MLLYENNNGYNLASSQNTSARAKNDFSGFKWGAFEKDLYIYIFNFFFTTVFLTLLEASNFALKEYNKCYNYLYKKVEFIELQRDCIIYQVLFKYLNK